MSIKRKISSFRDIYKIFREDDMSKDSLMFEFVDHIGTELITQIKNAFDEFARFLDAFENFFRDILATGIYWEYHVDEDRPQKGDSEEWIEEWRRRIEYSWQNLFSRETIRGIRSIVKYVTGRDIYRNKKKRRGKGGD